MKRMFCLFAVALLLAGCQMFPWLPDLPLIERVRQAHSAQRWYEHEAVSARMNVHFGGNHVLSGRFIFTPSANKVRAELDNGTTIVFDGETCWLSPANSDFDRPRFHVLTWPYFLAAAYKLKDPGTNFKPLNQPLTYQGKAYEGAKLTFDPGTGDAPDDWYILYVDPDNDLLRAMSYIVTYGKGDEAQTEPHAIVYNDYVRIGGALVSRSWAFYHWSEEQGIHGDPIGRVNVSDVHHVRPDEDTFTKPYGAWEETLPGR